MKYLICFIAISLTACSGTRPYERKAWAKASIEEAEAECRNENRSGGISLAQCMRSKGWEPQ